MAPPVAVPLLVAYCTVTVLPGGPDRSTVIVALVPSSLTVYAVASNCRTTSSSWIVTFEMLVLPRRAPAEGLDSTTSKRSLPSGRLSLRIGTGNVRLVTPAAKVSVPLVMV